MRIIFLILLCFATSLGAQEREREIELPFVTLVQPANVKPLEHVQLSEERVNEIHNIINDLANAEKQDVYLYPSPWKSDFVPVGKFSVFGDWENEEIEVSNSVRKLIEFGPEALPYLLERLDDHTPTKIVVNSVKSEYQTAGGMAFDEIMHGNPVHPIERSVLNLNRYPSTPSIQPKFTFGVSPELESYRVKVGDLCFVIIGQIVGRRYECLKSPHVKSASILVCSPVHRKNIRTRVREIWKTENPKQKLLESLLLDFATRGVLEMDPHDVWGLGKGWEIGSDFQVESVKRLLYYYPDISVPLTVDRINNLQTTDNHFDDYIVNGLRADDFVDSMAWFENDEIKAALVNLSKRASENNLVRALKRAGITPPK